MPIRNKLIANLNKNAASWNIKVSEYRRASKTMDEQQGLKLLAQSKALGNKVDKASERRGSGNHLVVEGLKAYSKRMKDKAENEKKSQFNTHENNNDDPHQGNNRSSPKKRHDNNTMPKSSQGNQFTFDNQGSPVKKQRHGSPNKYDGQNNQGRGRSGQDNDDRDNRKSSNKANGSPKKDDRGKSNKEPTKLTPEPVSIMNDSSVSQGGRSWAMLSTRNYDGSNIGSESMLYKPGGSGNSDMRTSSLCSGGTTSRDYLAPARKESSSHRNIINEEEDSMNTPARLPSKRDDSSPKKMNFNSSSESQDRPNPKKSPPKRPQANTDTPQDTPNRYDHGGTSNKYETPDMRSSPKKALAYSTNQRSPAKNRPTPTHLTPVKLFHDGPGPRDSNAKPNRKESGGQLSVNQEGPGEDGSLMESTGNSIKKGDFTLGYELSKKERRKMKAKHKRIREYVAKEGDDDEYSLRD